MRGESLRFMPSVSVLFFGPDSCAYATMATMAAIEPRMAGVSAPSHRAHAYCTDREMPPVQSDRTMFRPTALRSVSVSMMKGMMKKRGESWTITKDEISRIVSVDAVPPAVTSLQRVVTGTPTAPKPVVTVLPNSATSAENIGLNPSPISMAAGMATAVPNPAIP